MSESPSEPPVIESRVFEEQFLETLPPHDAELLRLVGQGFASALAEPEPSGTVLDPLREILDALNLSALRPVEDREHAIDRFELYVGSYRKMVEELVRECLAATRTLLLRDQRLRQVLDMEDLHGRWDIPPVTAAIARKVVPRAITAFGLAMEGMAHWILQGGTGRPSGREAAADLLRASSPLIDTLRVQLREDLEILGDQEEVADLLHRVDQHLASAQELLTEGTAD